MTRKKGPQDRREVVSLIYKEKSHGLSLGTKDKNKNDGRGVGSLTSVYTVWFFSCLACYLYNIITGNGGNGWHILFYAVIPFALQTISFLAAVKSRKQERMTLYILFLALAQLIPALALYMVQAAEIALLLPVTYLTLGLFNIDKYKATRVDAAIVAVVTVLVKCGRWLAYATNERVVSAVPEVLMFCSTVGAMAIIFRRNSEDKAAVAEMYKEAKQAMNIDGLTGLLNRKGMETLIASYQKKTSVFSVIMMDIDNFKRVNDTYGHPFGDIVLKGLSEVLTTNVRCTDTVFRYGGEEFLIVCAGTNKEQAVQVAEKVRKAFAAKKFPHGDEDLSFTISLGVAECTYRQYKSVDDLKQAADDKLYEAKHTGKNRVAS
jgi:diguanylate cyclase (GGDEF)-like protein